MSNGCQPPSNRRRLPSNRRWLREVRPTACLNNWLATGRAQFVFVFVSTRRDAHRREGHQLWQVPSVSTENTHWEVLPPPPPPSPRAHAVTFFSAGNNDSEGDDMGPRVQRPPGPPHARPQAPTPSYPPVRTCGEGGPRAAGLWRRGDGARRDLRCGSFLR